MDPAETMSLLRFLEDARKRKESQGGQPAK